MKLLCLRDSITASYGKHDLALTIGKIYDTIPFEPEYYVEGSILNEMPHRMWRVINDDNYKMNYSKEYNIFLSNAEWREKQIDEILN